MSRKNRNRPKSPTSLVDIVIITGGRWDMLEKCLASIHEKTSVPYHIILIDNNSPAEERIEHQNCFDGVTSKRLTNPVGYAAANNEGARMGSAPLILLLNDDVELTDGCIDKMVATMDDPQWSVVGAKLLFPENSSSPIRPAGKVQHIGHALNIQAQVIHPLVGWSKDHPKTCVSREVFSVTGACMMVRRSLWNKVGGLDTVYGAGTYEEVDLCLKIKQLGGKIYVNTDAIAYHYTGATAEKKQTAFPMQINHMTFISRWSGSGLLSWDDWSFW
jgi:GT2 family glycosyltransferase